ncbi:hypothetical protein AVEN_144466-1 [Araneus ventricosus]|uniref:Uncharacterized protein n=1 Tax=Araneus ventricosus TaxID=182803 RepID=A0A4Y2E0N6_ARAVE|nr:hypothetical protein AVEN_144466-1 [Araneus ventricosus]
MPGPCKALPFILKILDVQETKQHGSFRLPFTIGYEAKRVRASQALMMIWLPPECNTASLSGTGPSEIVTAVEIMDDRFLSLYNWDSPIKPDSTLGSFRIAVVN